MFVKKVSLIKLKMSKCGINAYSVKFVGLKLVKCEKKDT